MTLDQYRKRIQELMLENDPELNKFKWFVRALTYIGVIYIMTYNCRPSYATRSFLGNYDMLDEFNFTRGALLRNCNSIIGTYAPKIVILVLSDILREVRKKSINII